MRFVTVSNNKRVHIIVKKANALLNNPAFEEMMDEVSAFHPKYTSPQVNGTYIWTRMQNDPSVIEVDCFKSKNPWTKSNGYTKDDGLTKIFLNTRKFFRSDASIVATLFHEAVHEIDNNDTQLFYHHGDNTPKGGTAPEVVADIIYKVESGLESTETSEIN